MSAQVAAGQHPYDRDMQSIERDLRQGVLSPEMAIRVHGVMFDRDGAIDAAATARHRAIWRDAPPPPDCC